MMDYREQLYVVAEGGTLAQAVQNANETLARYAKDGWAVESEHLVVSQTVHLPAAAPTRIVMRLGRDAMMAHYYDDERAMARARTDELVDTLFGDDPESEL